MQVNDSKRKADLLFLNRVFFMYRMQFSSYFSFIIMIVLTAGLVMPAVAETRGIAVEAVKSKPANVINTGVYRALIMGNNDYRDQASRWKSLTTPVNDAMAVKDVMAREYGFSDIKLLKNASRRDVILALQQLAERVSPDDNVLVYYAGHGYLDTEAKRGFWVPVDAEGDDQTTFLRNSTIRDELSLIASRVRHTLLISDSCFSGALLRGMTRGISPDRNDASYYTKVAQKKSVQILAAGGLEYVDDNYKNTGHSPFSYFLINELKNNQSPMLALSELSTDVEKSVANNVDQVPESGVLQGAGDERGEFIFIKLKVGVKGVPADKVKVQVQVVPADEIKQARPVTDQNRFYSMPLPTL